ALERIDERVVAGVDRMREQRARRQLDVEIQRISGESLDRTRRLAAIEDEGARDHLDAAAAGEIDDWDLLGLDVAIPGRLYLFFRRKVDPELEAAHAPLLLLRHLGMDDPAAGGHPLHAAALQIALVSEMIFVPQVAVEHVGDGPEAAVRVRGKTRDGDG